MPNRAYGAWEGRGREGNKIPVADGEGMAPPSSLGQAPRGNETGWARGWEVGEGDGSPARTTDGEGMDSRPRLHWGRLYAGTNGSGCGNDGLGREDGRWGKGMGPRIREDNGWGRDGFPPPSSLGQALRGNNGSGCGNDGLGARMGGGGRGWVPASARTTDGEGMDSRPRLHGGRLLGEGEGQVLWVPAFAGKTGVCGTGDHKGRPYGEGN